MLKIKFTSTISKYCNWIKILSKQRPLFPVEISYACMMYMKTLLQHSYVTCTHTHLQCSQHSSPPLAELVDQYRCLPWPDEEKYLSHFKHVENVNVHSRHSDGNLVMWFCFLFIVATNIGSSSESTSSLSSWIFRHFFILLLINTPLPRLPRFLPVHSQRTARRCFRVNWPCPVK